MTYIGLGRRFVAWVVDGLITGLAWLPFAETSSVDGTYSIRWDGVDFLIPLLITLAYFVLLEGAFGGPSARWCSASGCGRSTATASGSAPPPSGTWPAWSTGSRTSSRTWWARSP